MLKFGKKVTIFTIRKENIEKKERTRMKKVEKRNFQSVKTKPGYVRTALPLLLLVVFAIMGLVIVEMIMEKDSSNQERLRVLITKVRCWVFLLTRRKDLRCLLRIRLMSN